MVAMKHAAIIVVLFLIISGQQSYSQRTIPVKDVPALQCGAWHRPTITEAPPYSLGMPLDVIYTYMAIDSLCKLDIERVNLFGLGMDTLTNNDIEILNKYVYKALDYNPFLFHNYLNVGWYINSEYYNHPEDIYNTYYDVAHEKLGGLALDNYIVFSHGIYEIEITDISIDSSLNSYPLDPDRLRDVVCLTGKVTDVIKGDALCSDCESGRDRCISFSYIRSTSTFVPPDERNGGSRIKGYYVIDSIGVDSLGNTIYEGRLSSESNIFATVHDPAIGDKYLVFLKIWTYGYVDQYGSPYYIVPMRMYQREGGMFNIENGNMKDSWNYFGQGASVDIRAFKALLRSYIQTTILQPGS